MSTAIIGQPDYDTKPAEYFECSRPEMIPFVPLSCRRILDVGCGCGTFGQRLKQSRDVEVWGVEPVAGAAAKAVDKLDRVIKGHFAPTPSLPLGAFDCIVFNDVLEHMIAPEEALRYANSLLSPGGIVVASIPNIRSLPTLWQILVYGSWKYESCGVLDAAHLRFFTKSTIADLFESEGYKLQTLVGLNPYIGVPNVSRRIWRAYTLVNVCCFGRFSDMKFQQFAVVASCLNPATKSEL